MQISILEIVSVRKYVIGFASMPHILLNSEITHRDVEMERGRHRNRGEIRRAVTARADVIDIGQGSDLLQGRDSSSVNYRHSDVVNQLFANQKVCIPNRIENFPYREWRRRMLANDAKSLLQFRRNRIFQPEQVIRLQVFSQSGGLNRSQPVMHVLKQVDLVPVPQPQRLKQLVGLQNIL